MVLIQKGHQWVAEEQMRQVTLTKEMLLHNCNVVVSITGICGSF